MVLPTLARNINTIQEWVEFVVWRCFASKSDKNLQNNVEHPELRAKWEDAVHSYRYNAFLGGTSNYTFDGGAIFDLDTWLANCTPPNEGQWFGVNCYDMSAVLQTALRLGLPYTFRDQGMEVYGVLSVAKSFRQPFGYIKPLDLIGWGMSNSPFFDDSEKMMLGLDKATSRQSFGNHAWVCVRITDTDRDSPLALDACAGPTATPVSMKEYLYNSVDVVATSNSASYSGFNKDQAPVELPGVQYTVVDQPLTAWQQTPFMGATTLPISYQNQNLGITSTGQPTNGLVAVQKLVASAAIQPIPVPVYNLVKAGFNATATALNLPVPPPNTAIQLQASDVFTYGPFTIQTPEPAVTSGGSIFRFSVWADTTGPPLINITVVVLTDLKTAVNYLISHFGMMNHTTQASWEITSAQISSGKIDLMPQKSVFVGASVRSNILVTIEGSNNMDVVTKVLSAMGDFTLPYFGKTLSTISVDSVQLLTSIPESPVIGSSTLLTFNVSSYVTAAQTVSNHYYLN